MAAIAATALLTVGVAHAGAVQSLDALQAAAVKAVRQAAPKDARVVAKAVGLDKRLRLPACAGKLTAMPPRLGRGTSRVSVPVSCTAGADWKVRVPVQVKLFRKVLVTSHDLARGDIVGAGDVHAEERNVARLGYGYIVNPKQLYGRRLQRALTVDTVVTPSMLAAREVVHRGQQVSLVARLHDILVRADGIALQSGDRGDVVKVRSLSCKCVVQGTVRAPGLVETLP